MNRWIFHTPKKWQYAVSIFAVGAILLLCSMLHDLIGYRVVALLLLATIAILALLVDVLPLILAAASSAIAWDFLFIPPRFEFSVGTTEDQLLLAMYFVLAVVYSVLTHEIKQSQKQVQLKETKARDLKFYNTLFNSLSHELRTPITTILGATDSLLNAETRLTGTQQKELLQEINSASLRLNRQVENLLGMSRLESGAIRLKKDWVDIKELIYTVITQLDLNLDGHKITVTVPESLPFYKIDFVIMEQILYNLVSNAIVHTPTGTHIFINADSSDDALRIVVSDTGTGFPEKEITKAFDKFYRFQRGHTGGTGLGLSIVKGFTEAHGGSVSLRNLPFSGAEFTLQIPAEASFINLLKNE
jgi:two-component system sensor histidine kinase KdpD